MLRREFIAGLGSAAALPVVVRAQQPERMRHIGVLMPWEENGPEGKRRHSAFIQALADLGWTDGRNVRIDLRWAGGDINRTRALAHELVGMQPDIIVPMGSTVATLALQRETRTIPIVFASVAAPIASGIVAGLDRPSGNITGFANLEASLGGKLLGLLLEIAPGLKRAAIIFNPDTPPYRFLCAHLRRRPGHSSSCRYARSQPRRDRNGHYRPWARTGRRPRHHAGCVHGGASRIDHIDGGPKSGTGGLLDISLCQKRRLALLRSRPDRHVSSWRKLMSIAFCAARSRVISRCNFRPSSRWS